MRPVGLQLMRVQRRQRRPYRQAVLHRVRLMLRVQRPVLVLLQEVVQQRLLVRRQLVQPQQQAGLQMRQ